MADHSDLGFQPAAHADLGFTPAKPQAVLDPSGATAQDAGGAVSRFLHNTWEQINPLPAIQEYFNRPDAAGDASRAFAAGMRIRAGKEQPGDRALLDKGMNANLGNTATPPIIPVGTEPIAKAGSQAQHGDLAGAAGTVTGAAIPLAAGAALTGKTPKPVGAPVVEAPGMAQRLYQGALNPRITTPAAEVRAMVDTGLEHSIPISEAGQAKLQNLLNELNQKIQERVQPAADRGVAIDPNKVVDRLQDVRERFGKQVNPKDDLAAINSSGKEFLSEVGGAAKPTPGKTSPIVDASGRPIVEPGTSASPAQPIPADLAQQIKVGTYQKLAGKYGDKATDAQVEAQKALARGIKEELATQIPELDALNAKEGRLLDLRGPLELAVAKAVNRSGKSGVSFPAAMTGGATAAVTGSAPVGGSVAILKTVLSDPAVRSRLAIIINQAQKKNPAKWGSPNMQAAIARISDLAGRLTLASQTSAQPQE